MTTPHRDDRIDEYLWDPMAPSDADVQAVESLLEPLAFDPSATPLKGERFQPVTKPRRRWWYGLAAAAVIVLATGWLAHQWRLSWPAGRAWPIEAMVGAGTDRLAVGSVLALSGSDRARVQIARIGTMEIAGDARVTLQSTQGARHRLNLERGTVRVRTWAPPGSVVFRTPIGEVIDLGCEFDLTTDADRTVVRVRSGWVQIANSIDESLIPAGAMSEMRAGRAPGVPVFEDATPGFAAAVRALEAGTGDASASVRTIVANARARDVFTLLMLVERGSRGGDLIAARAAELWPPPDDVSATGVARGDRDGLWRWRDTLPLPPPKGWLRNWRDALPDWLVGRQ